MAGHPIADPTPAQLRNRARKIVYKAIRNGELPRLDGSILCMDCGAPAVCYDHRNYHHPLAVDPVCKRCNNRRGPGFPINPALSEYHNGWEGSAGQRWSAVEGGANPERQYLDHWGKDASGGSGGGVNFPEDHWVTFEPDYDWWKARQEASRLRGDSGASFYRSFERGLADWFGVGPI